MRWGQAIEIAATTAQSPPSRTPGRSPGGVRQELALPPMAVASSARTLQALRRRGLGEELVRAVGGGAAHGAGGGAARQLELDAVAPRVQPRRPLHLRHAV